MQLSHVEQLRVLAPGVMASPGVAIAATFLNEHYAAPAMLFALLLGLSFKFIVFSSATILRIGVALLGFRMKTDQVAALGPFALLAIITSVTLIICLGFEVDPISWTECCPVQAKVSRVKFAG